MPEKQRDDPRELIRLVSNLSACAVDLEKMGLTTTSKNVFMIVAELIEYLRVVSS